MTPTQARAFYAVAKAGTFSGAARQLNVSQPTLTVQVKELEMRCGVELFIRNSTGARLTEAGAGLFPLVEKWDVARRECNDFLQSIRAFETGELVIGTYGPFEAIRLAALMRQQHGAIKISVVFGNSHELMDSLRSSTVDVAVMSGATNLPDFHCIEYRQKRLVAIVPIDEIWATKTSVTTEELDNFPLIIREQGSIVREHLEHATEARGVAFSPDLVIGSREGVVAAVQQGLGVGIIFDEGLLPEDHVRSIPISDIPHQGTVDVVCLKGRMENTVVNRFMDIAKRDTPPK